MAKKLKTMLQGFDFVDIATGKCVRAVALDIFDAMRAKPPTGTPLDTRFHAASWNYSVNRLDNSIADRKLRKGPLSVPLRPEPDRAVRVRTGDVLHISNAADVIVPLIKGEVSKQSPAGFFQIAVARAVGRATSIYRGALARP